MAKRRQSIDIEGVGHSNPIPFASKVGNIVHTGGIFGADPATHAVPPEPERQAALIFQHMRAVMEKAGGSPDDIVFVTFFVKDLQYRELINAEWVKMFPDAESRPARHTMTQALAGASVMQCEFMAVLAE